MMLISEKHYMNNIALWSFKTISALSIGQSHKPLTHIPKSHWHIPYIKTFLIYPFTLWIRHLHLFESHTWPIPSWDLQPYDDKPSIYITSWVIKKKRSTYKTNRLQLSFIIFVYKTQKITNNMNGRQDIRMKTNFLLHFHSFLWKKYNKIHEIEK